MTRFVFVTGGVVSSIGKGLLTASLASQLEARRLSVNILKMDPYINVDPGTMSPFQHGEVFVTADGAETDLDLGHYERFSTVKMTKKNTPKSGSPALFWVLFGAPFGALEPNTSTSLRNQLLLHSVSRMTTGMVSSRLWRTGRRNERSTLKQRSR